MQGLEGQRVLVLGLGVSGRSAARFCAEHGATVLAADEREEIETGELASLGPRVELRCGRPFPDPADFDLVVPSPGVPPERYASRAKKVWGDVELAFRALAVPIIAVTGTNGKSTTASLLEAMLRAAGLRVRAAGNLGDPALGLVGEALDAAVLEVSSFQLESVDSFRPRVAVLLGVTEDHLDRHGSLAAYAAAKARIFAQQQPADFAVVNGDDALALGLARQGRGALLQFRRRRAVERGAWWEADGPVLRLDAPPRHFPLAASRGAPLPPQENILAALLAATALGAEPSRALTALMDFRGLPHRLEWVALRGGVHWIDDSKATNPGAAQRALEAVEAPVLWIAGGRDKGLDFGALAETAAQRVRRAYLIGEAAEKLATVLRPRVEVELVPDLKSAVSRAARQARAGETVLLAPACASFDQFASFEERGRCFQQAVAQLPEVAS